MTDQRTTPLRERMIEDNRAPSTTAASGPASSLRLQCQHNFLDGCQGLREIVATLQFWDSHGSAPGK